MDINGRNIHDVDKQSESLVYRHPCKATPDHYLVCCDKTDDSALRYSRDTLKSSSVIFPPHSLRRQGFFLSNHPT